MSIQWPLIILSYLGLIALGLLDNVRGPFFPQILHELELTQAKGALFFSLSSLASFSTSFALRRHINRLGSWLVLRLSLILMGVGFILISLNTNYYFMLLFSLMFGSGVGAMSLAQNVAVKEGSDEGSRRRLFAGLHSMYGLSALIAPIISAYMMDLGLNWRRVFAMVALFPITLATVSILYRNKKVTATSVVAVAPPSNLGTGHSLFFASIAAFYIMSEVALSTRLPLFAVTELNLSEQQGSKMLAWFFLGLLVGRIVFMVLPLKSIRDEWILYVSGWVSSALFILGLWWNPFLLTLCGWTMAPFYPVALEYLVKVFGKWSGAAMAHTIGFGSLGVVFMHYLLGIFSDVYGLRVTLSVFPILLCVITFMVWLRPRIFSLPVEQSS